MYYAMWSCAIKDEDYIGQQVLMSTSKDTVLWSEYIDLHIPCSPNIAPRRLAGGRLIMCGHVTFPYTDDPYGIDGRKIAGISPVLPDGLVDDPVNGPKYFKMCGEEC